MRTRKERSVEVVKVCRKIYLFNTTTPPHPRVVFVLFVRCGREFVKF